MKPREQNSNANRVPFVITFNPALPNPASTVRKHLGILQSSNHCKQTFSSPPVLAYKRSASLRDLLVRTRLRDPKNKDQRSTAGIYRCKHPRCLTCPFLQDGQDKYIFFSTNEERRIKDTLTCKSKNLIYLIECKKCATRNLPCQYIGETKRHLHERFGEHRRSVQNHQQLANPTPVSEHFNLPGHSVNDIRLIPLELIHTNRDSVRKAREAHLIDKAKTLEPQGLNRRDELH